ncbi:MAG TPA: STAS domain-containing protein [Tepidisphaeraceae bacterium]|jgi:anti-anti-sigma factor|nr:STAS domain-containing protein [Tepidisphaeraceae bacterium]
MPVKCDEYGQVCVLTIDGDFVGDDVATLRNAVDKEIDRHQIVDFVVDLEKCNFIDSDGLEALVWVRQRTDDLFGQVKLANLDANIRTILEMTRLTQRFECHEELAGALKTMR